ncbi:hypothetical protein BSP14_154 [Bacillus phage BSP14]|nr:hypothetical protein BSP14_154 [Bacillus phage BSP14]
MSKFTNLESLARQIDLWVDSRLANMERYFDGVVNSENTVDQKVLELEKLDGTGGIVANLLLIVFDSSSETHLKLSQGLEALGQKIRAKISEYRDLPVVPEETAKERAPTPRKATELEMAFKEAVEQLSSEAVILAKYPVGSAALQTAYDRTKTLLDLLPAGTSELPKELKNVSFSLNAIEKRLYTEIGRLSPQVRGSE